MTTSPHSAPESVSGALDQPVELSWEQAVAFGIEGFDPADPWNAALCVEGETTATVLPLTPKHLDYLTEQLREVRDAQRAALGVPVEDDGLAGDEDGQPDSEENPGALRKVANAARVATGSQQVSALWSGSRRGRITIIVVTLVFVCLGVILSVAT